MTETRPTGAATADRLPLLVDLGRRLAAARSEETTYEALHDHASRILPVCTFWIARPDHSGETLGLRFLVHRGRRVHLDLAFRAEHPAGATVLDPADPALALLRLAYEPTAEARSALAVPVLGNDRLLAIMGFLSLDGDAFDDAALDAASALAALAGLALGAHEEVRRTERRRQEAERLAALGRDLTASLDLDQVLERVVAAAAELLQAPSAAVLLIDGGRLRLAGRPTGSGGDGEVVLPPRLLDRIVDRREPLLIQQRQPPLLPAGPGAAAATEVAAVPLVTGDEVIGLLAVPRFGDRPFLPDEVALLQRFSFQVANAIENARLHDTVRALSLTDPLTGLPNRRHLERVLEREFAAARRGRKLAVVLFDLDDFKRYNDTAGHQAGDDALREFGRVLAAETRAFDLAARYGGDEFLAILSGAGAEGAEAHTARVRAGVAAVPLLAGMGVSAGIACYADDMRSAEDLVRAADRDLYRRKAQRAGTRGAE